MQHNRNVNLLQVNVSRVKTALDVFDVCNQLLLVAIEKNAIKSVRILSCKLQQHWEMSLTVCGQQTTY